MEQTIDGRNLSSERDRDRMPLKEELRLLQEKKTASARHHERADIFESIDN